MDFPSSVAPFILRGITLVGIDSVNASIERRQVAWQKLADTLNPETFEKVVTKINLTDAIEAAGKLLDGEIQGRVVVDVNA